MNIINLYIGGKSLDVYAQDIEWSWTNIRFSDGLRDQYSTDITLPKTNNNMRVLEVSGLLDSATQMYGTQLTPSTLEMSGDMMSVYVQVVEITEDAIRICLYERTLPKETRERNIARFATDDYTSIWAWNVNTDGLYTNDFLEYSYGMPFAHNYAQRHPVKKANVLMQAIQAECGVEVPVLPDNWYVMATGKWVCPQNTHQYVEGFMKNDNTFCITGGQHTCNDLEFSYGETDNNKITFNRDCTVTLDIWVSWHSKNNGYKVPFLVNHHKSGGANDTRELQLDGLNYTNDVNTDSCTFQVSAGDHISFAIANGDRFQMVRMLAHLQITNYAVSDDDYGIEMKYVSRLPRLIVYNYAANRYDIWWFDASTYVLAYHRKGTSNTLHRQIQTAWGSFAWFGFWANLPEMKVSDFIWGLCWLGGWKPIVENGVLVFSDANQTATLNNGTVTKIEPYSGRFGRENLIVYDGENGNPVSRINNVWLEERKNLHQSPFGYARNTTAYSCEIAQYGNPEHDPETGEYSCDFTEIGFMVLERVTQQGGLTVQSPYIKGISLNTMGLERITQTMTATIETEDTELKDKDYLYLHGRKYMTVEGTTDLTARKSTITAVLVPTE